jgi:hypothetical protein
MLDELGKPLITRDGHRIATTLFAVSDAVVCDENMHSLIHGLTDCGLSDVSATRVGYFIVFRKLAFLSLVFAAGVQFTASAFGDEQRRMLKII